MSSPNLVSKWASLTPYLGSLLRIVAAFMFMTAGTTKLFGFPADMPGGGPPPAFSQIWFAGVLETFGGALLVLGLCTRPVAFLLSGEMAVAFFQVHLPQSPWPTINMGVSAVLYCFIWLFFSAYGGGPWSVDHWLRQRRDHERSMR
jgi:putative oxidoreductase